MKQIALMGTLLASAPALAQAQSTTPVTNAPPAASNFVEQQRPSQTSSNPWDVVPPKVPYWNLVEEITATSKPGQPSPLNPSCAGKRGDECVRSAEAPK